MNISHLERPHDKRAVPLPPIVTIVLSLLAGLVAVGAPVPAQAADPPTPVTHTLDYIVVSSSSGAGWISTDELASLTGAVSDGWNRLSRGAVPEITMGQVWRMPSFSGDFCDLDRKNLTEYVPTSLGYSPADYTDQNNGRTLVVLATDPDTGCDFSGLAIVTGDSLSASGIILVAMSGPAESNADTVVHELGHVFGLGHAGTIPGTCLPNFWDGPFSAAGTSVLPDRCPIGVESAEYGDDANIMGRGVLVDELDLNGAQKYQLGVIKPGAGVKEVTPGADEQLITINDSHTADTSVLQSVRMTGDDPDGPGPCSPGIYFIDYDQQAGGVRVFRVPVPSDCATANVANAYFGTIAWTAPVSFSTTRSYFLPGESRLTQSGKVQVRVVSRDTTAKTATVAIRRTDVPGVATLQLTSRVLADNTVQSEASGGHARATVTTNQASWSAQTSQSWVTVTPSGTSGQEVVVTVAPNPAFAQRTAVVTVTAGSAPATTISIVQKAGPSQDDCSASLTWNCRWADMTSAVAGRMETPGDKDWFEITPRVSGTWSFTVSSADGLSYPVAAIILGNGAELEATKEAIGNTQYRITVKLEAAYPYWLQVTGSGTGTYTVTPTPAPVSITLVWKTWNPSGNGDATFMRVTSNAVWQLGPMPDWLRLDTTSGYGLVDPYIYADPNPTGATRTWPVTFTAEGVTATITVTQQPGVVNPLDCGVTPATACSQADLASAQRTVIDYAGDRDWFRLTPDISGTWAFKAANWVGRLVLIAADGVTPVLTAKRGLGDAFTMNASLTAGETYYLEVSGYGFTHEPYTITVTPPVDPTPPEPYFWTDPRSWEAPPAGGSQAIEVTTNQEWSIIAPAWITVSVASGKGDGTVNLTVPANTTGAARSGWVYFVTSGRMTGVYVSQEPQPEPRPITIRPQVWLVPGGGGWMSGYVNTDQEWAVTSQPDWIWTNMIAGDGGTWVYLYAWANPGSEERFGEVVFTNASGQQDILWLGQYVA